MQNELTPIQTYAIEIYNDINRDCWYNKITIKVFIKFPDMTADDEVQLDNFIRVHHQKEIGKLIEKNKSKFYSSRWFEDICDDLSGDNSTSEINRNELYEAFKDSEEFSEAYFEYNNDRSNDHDEIDCDSHLTYREQCDADRSDYADTFQCPIQRAEIRMGA